MLSFSPTHKPFYDDQNYENELPNKWSLLSDKVLYQLALTFETTCM
jgi:hypothetical protein